MNLDKIKLIVDADYLSYENKEFQIIECLSKDENVIPLMLKILEREREFKEDCLLDMNYLLSKADVGLDNKKFNKGNFIQKEIYDFYLKYKGFVGHCFKILFK